MIRRVFPALLAVLLVVVSRDAMSAGPVEEPRLTARSQSALTDLALTSLDEKQAFKHSQSVVGKPVGDFVLLDRQERPVPLSRYRGKPLLVNFMYTACFQVCPTTTRNLQKALESAVTALGPDRFNVVSIGFNQPFDSPQALKAFSFQHGIHLPNWEFLSPAPAIVADLTQNFGFSYVATTAGFDHLNQVSIVDAEGKIVRQVYGEKFTAQDLVEPLKLMVTGAPLPLRVGTLEELVERVRILCSVYDPITGRYRTNYALYFQFAGFLTFMIFMVWLAWSFMLSRRGDRT